jgi:hypothetical protein
VKKSKGQPIGEPFAPLLDRLIYGAAYQALPPLARSILVFMVAEAPRPYNGEEIVMGARAAAAHCQCHFTTTWRAMRVIHDSGLATIADLGRRVQNVDINRATRWRLDFWEKEPHGSASATKGCCASATQRTPRVASALHRRVAPALQYLSRISYRRVDHGSRKENLSHGIPCSTKIGFVR